MSLVVAKCRSRDLNPDAFRRGILSLSRGSRAALTRPLKSLQTLVLTHIGLFTGLAHLGRVSADIVRMEIGQSSCRKPRSWGVDGRM